MPTSYDLTGHIPSLLDMGAIQKVDFANPTGDTVSLDNFEKGTTAKITAVTRQSNRGETRVVWYKLDCTLLIVINRLSNVPSTLDHFLNCNLQTDIHIGNEGLDRDSVLDKVLTFSDSERDVYDDYRDTYADDFTEGFDNRATMTYDIEIVDEMRIRIVLKVQGWIQKLRFVRLLY